MKSLRLGTVLCAAAVILIGYTGAFGQQQAKQDNPFPASDNQWHLGYSVQSFDSVGTFENVEGHQHGDQSPTRPMETSGIFTNNSADKVVLANPPVDCQNTGPAETNACTFTSSSAVQVDSNHIKYTFRNWGGRCILSLRVMRYKPILVWKWAEQSPWSTGSPFIVVVPEEAAPGTAAVFGKLDGKNIYMIPSDPLSSADDKYFKLLEPKKVVPGLGTIYRFQTKEQ
jgi:hypothetical protein